MVTCTQCDATYEQHQAKCSKCGYALPTNWDGSGQAAVSDGAGMKGAGVAFLISGIAGALYFLFGFDTSVANSSGLGTERIINMGLANDRAVGVTFSSALMIVGAVFMARR